MDRILVTGSAGFIGTNLMEYLGERGVPFDLKHGQDVRRDVDIGRAVEGVDGVIHLAAAAGVEASIRNPEATVDTNVVGTLRALEACRRARVPMLLASTAGALAGPPRSPYGASKLAGEAYCDAYAAAYGLRTIVARLSSVYGPHSRHKQTAIPALCRAALEGRPFALFGSGQQVRDFVYVGDVVAGMVALLEAGHGRFDLTSGRPTSINDLIVAMQVVVGKSIGVARQQARQGEALGLPADIDWRARHYGYRITTPLPEGLRLTWDWFRAA